MSSTQRTNQASPAAPSTERVKELIAAYDLGAEHRIPRELAAALRELLSTRERLQAATDSAEKLVSVPGLCDSECEGRCPCCPADEARKLLAILKGEQ